MTSAFLPSHRAVPVTAASPLEDNASANSEPVQEMVKAKKVGSQMEMSDSAKQSTQTVIRVLVVDDH